MSAPASGTVAVAIMCKTPIAGASKTRLSPPLAPHECAQLSGCFIRDLAQTIDSLGDDLKAVPYAVYTPRGTEAALMTLLTPRFRLIPQCEGDFGVRLLQAIRDLLGAGHVGAILVNSDSPTLPRTILLEAVEAVRRGDNVTLSPAADGGYTLIGLSQPHARLFDDIPWSTADVYRLTLERAAQSGVPVAVVAGWYDVDDAGSLQTLVDELDGRGVVGAHRGAYAPATRQFLAERRRRAGAGG